MELFRFQEQTNGVGLFEMLYQYHIALQGPT